LGRPTTLIPPFVKRKLHPETLFEKLAKLPDFPVLASVEIT